MPKPTLHTTSSNPCVFFKNHDDCPLILKGKLDYNEAFAAFLRATNQKKHTADIVGLFINTLLEQGLMPTCSGVLSVADIGCADAKACLGFLEKISNNKKFQYTGVDINDKFLEEADSNLSSHPAITDHTLVGEDILSNGIAALSPMHHKTFNLIFVSHVAYYLKNPSSGAKFVDNIHNMLSTHGLGIFLHEASTHHFRSTYNKKYQSFNAPEMLKASIDVLIEKPEQYNEVKFTSKLTFTEMNEMLWEAAKNPDVYKQHADKPHFIDNLNKLSFIVQCDLSQLFEDGTLTNYINEIKTILETNNYYIDLTTCMQILVSPQNTYMNEIRKLSCEIKDMADLVTIEQPNIQDSSSSSACYN